MHNTHNEREESAINNTISQNLLRNNSNKYLIRRGYVNILERTLKGNIK